MMPKEIIRTMMYFVAVCISVWSCIYGFSLSKDLEEDELKQLKLWADAVDEIKNADLDQQVSLIAYKRLQENTRIPIILFYAEGEYEYRNIEIDTSEMPLEDFLREECKKMNNNSSSPIKIQRDRGNWDLLYYGESINLEKIKKYPVWQFIVTIFIIIFTFIGLRASNKADQNKVMVGMSKETAHQLGTPISSLLAWIEMLKLEKYNPEVTDEVEKDVKRLEKIAERFSRIGNKPELTETDICPVLNSVLTYLHSRTSQFIEYDIHIPEKSIILPLNTSLFEWVIENICKNAIDAMQGKGKLSIRLSEDKEYVKIDIKDTGKGFTKKYYKRIFKPGFTTKKHGWGLGLSLAQRIINDYHKGSVFVKDSEPGKGTTFRILLPKKKKISKKSKIFGTFSKIFRIT